jgi:hypothetical protein
MTFAPTRIITGSVVSGVTSSSSVLQALSNKAMQLYIIVNSNSLRVMGSESG